MVGFCLDYRWSLPAVLTGGLPPVLTGGLPPAATAVATGLTMLAADL